MLEYDDLIMCRLIARMFVNMEYITKDNKTIFSNNKELSKKYNDIHKELIECFKSEDIEMNAITTYSKYVGEERSEVQVIFDYLKFPFKISEDLFSILKGSSYCCDNELHSPIVSLGFTGRYYDFERDTRCIINAIYSKKKE